jgi:MYXO-CTERM domain-containing protein
MTLSLLLLVGLAQASTCPNLEAELSALDHGGRCLTMPLRDAWLSASARGAQGCLVEALAARGLAHGTPPAFGRQAPPPPLPDKQIRDTYDLPNSVETDNFIGWWGDGASVSRHDVEDMLDAFEEGWIHLVDTMELPPPEDSATYKFNVYIGDSGSGAPSAYGNAGYFWYDSAGQPLIVMALSSLHDPEWRDTTAVHELFHAVQAATGNYATSSGSWLWEASSTWVEGEIYPESPYYAAFLFGFAFLPHLPLDFYDYPDTGTLQEYHQYGAFIFPRYLSEIAFDWGIMRDVWLEGSPGGDPISVFGQLMADMGADFDELWADFIAHNAAWDYVDGDTYGWYLDFYADYYDDYRLAGYHVNEGARAWQAPTRRLPEAYGAQTIQLRYPSDGTLHLELALEETGSAGSEATWWVTLVREGFELDYERLEVVDGLVEHSVEGVGEETSIYLVLGPTNTQRRSGETFGYSYRLWVEVEGAETGAPDDTGDGPGTEKPGGCACSGQGPVAPVAGLGLGVLGLVGLRRRRS